VLLNNGVEPMPWRILVLLNNGVEPMPWRMNTTTNTNEFNILRNG
jgi:hypothetical protein